MLQEVECIVSDKIIDDEMFYTVRRMDTDEKSEKKLADFFLSGDDSQIIMNVRKWERERGMSLDAGRLQLMILLL